MDEWMRDSEHKARMIRIEKKHFKMLHNRQKKVDAVKIIETAYKLYLDKKIIK